MNVIPRTTPEGKNEKPMEQATKDSFNVASKRKRSTSPQEQSPYARRRRYSQPRTKRSPQLKDLANTQRYINQLKIQPAIGLDKQNKNALKEAPYLEAGNLYLICHAQSCRWLAALLLPLNDLHCVGILGTIDTLGLSKNTPNCVTYDLDSSEFQWRDGFGDGEPFSHQRKFPIAYYVSDPNSPESFDTQWVEAESLWDLRSWGLKLDEQSEAQAVAARLTSRSTTRLTTSSFPTISPSITLTTTKSPPNRTHIIRTSPHSLAAGERSSVERILPDKIPEIPRTLEQSPQCSATVDKLSKGTGIPSSSSEIRGIYTGIDIQQMPRHTQLPGIMQVASRWPQPLSDRILRQLATKSIDAISSGPEDFKIGGPKEVYYCPLCSNKKRFLQVETFIKHLSDIHR
ncbi:hypothetical protein AU210_016156 [Fusarium oxysporum f. sp. radicis-cucumerinum]|uniref:Uncharacterized protein n=1 Tax=Fusarium oxysporum f. sp. radicis-cucumerinum TaxID=327505 RepID=A0A2H3FXC1_FUSOX|nr:hypothetical protein AU210_016156 [Fusarium oxysporum f. sp. radicis-cucumerinum]